MILTVDLGTTTTKAAVWDLAGLGAGGGTRLAGERAGDGGGGRGGLVALGRAQLVTTHPGVDRAEQAPSAWWASVVEACAAARAADAAAFEAVEAVGFSAARQTFVPATAAGAPLGPGLLWSDRRAAAEAAALAGACGGADMVRRRTGLPLDAGAVAAKVAWLWSHEPRRMAASRWLLSPRDLIVWRMCGEVVTDTTLASATGLYDSTGRLVAELVGEAAGRLPTPVGPASVVGGLLAEAAAELDLRPGIPIVIGAGDRPCEVLGTGASNARPMISWGTTANVSVPVDLWPEPLPDGLAVTRAALDGWLVEGGLSAAGTLIAWLATLTGLDAEVLVREAAASPPGARGVIALPWLSGARAPWWRDGAGAAFLGLSPVHQAGDLTRAAVESVAWDLERCLDAVVGEHPHTSLALAGGGAAVALWVEVVTSVVGLAGVRRRSGEAASAGAAVLTARATDVDLTADELDPVVSEVSPLPEMVGHYRRLRPRRDRVAEAVIALELGSIDADHS